MADKNDASELLAEMLIRMDRQQEETKETNNILRGVVDMQNRMLERMDRSEAGFNNFALAVLDHLQGIKTELAEVKADVSDLKTEQKRTTEAIARFADHEERLRRPEDFMRRAS